ncbi:MAG: EscR/YscR/HrcR family type III secretion system export apparatus protein [Armatimonadetes bacterium]|nr:EscR/YscR/HrcR family type III secretion system export apparatus protein [Armatimonadota bacterium]
MTSLVLSCTAWVWAQPDQVGNNRFLVAVLAAFVLPSLLAVTTAFARIVVVLYFLRAGLGSNAIPPNAVIVGLALLLTWLAMGPTVNHLSNTVLAPLYRGQISAEDALRRCEASLRAFMVKHVGREDFDIIAGSVRQKTTPDRAAFPLLATAFALSELRIAFVAGLLIYLPFLVVDVLVYLVVSAIGTGPFSPQLISLPVKVAFFVMADGWRLLFRAVLGGYGG